MAPSPVSMGSKSAKSRDHSVDSQNLYTVVPGYLKIHCSLLQLAPNSFDGSNGFLQALSRTFNNYLNAHIGVVCAVLIDPVPGYEPLVGHSSKRLPQRIDDSRQD